MSQGFDGVASLKEIKLFVRLCSVGAFFVYPMWSFIYNFSIPPPVDDPLWERLLVGVYCLLVFGASFIPIFYRWLLPLTYSAIYLATLHLFWLTVRNDVHPGYQVGIISVFCAITPYFYSLRSLFYYMGFSAILCIGVAFYQFKVADLTFYAAAFSVLFMSVIGLNARLRILHKLDEKRREVQDASLKIQEKSQKLKSIMGHIQQGIFTIENFDGSLGAEYSQKLLSLFQLDKGSEFNNIAQILDQLAINANDRDQVLAAIQSSIGVESLNFEANAHLLPAELRTKDRKKIIEFTWDTIQEAQTDRVEKILVAARDVTSLRQMQEESARIERDLHLISEIVHITEPKFHPLLGSCRRFLEDGLVILDKIDPMAIEIGDIHQLYRGMHTFKGVSRSYGMRQLSNLAHSAEEEIHNLQKESSHDTWWRVKESYKVIMSCLDNYEKLALDKLGWKESQRESLLIDREDLNHIYQFIKKSSPDSISQAHLQKALDTLEKKLFVSLSEVLTPLMDNMKDLSLSLQKELPRIVIRDADVSFKPLSAELLKNVFSHLLRNSLDHGIEASQLRIKKGKEAFGSIYISLLPEDRFLCIEVYDDGEGLNLRKIRDKAIEKGLWSTDKKDNPHALAMLIFHPQFSTREQVTDISGRGVGMDAVKTFIENFGGNIQIILENPEENQTRFRLQIRLPQHHFQFHAEPLNATYSQIA